MKTKNKMGLDRLLDLIKSGKSPAEISRRFDIPKQTLDNKIQKLKKFGCIEKKGYGVWEYLKEVPKEPKGSMEGKGQIRGHAFIWKIDFFGNDIGWKTKIKSYKKKKLTFQKICNNKVFRTIYNNRKIWLTNKGMIIYEPLCFYGGSSFKVKGTAVFEMDQLIKDFFKELNIKFRVYRFTTSREHYGIIKNELARQHNERKEKLAIRGEDGTIWMWIDDSKGLAELENNEPVVNRQVQKWWNKKKKNNFAVDDDLILDNFKESAKQIKKNAENLDYHAENMKSHVGAIRVLAEKEETSSRIVKELGEGVKELVRVVQDLKENINKTPSEIRDQGKGSSINKNSNLYWGV